MSITDELRERIAAVCKVSGLDGERLYAIADRIDEQHKHDVMSAMNDALYHANDESMAELGWLRLPKDADGKVIHVEDEVELLDGSKRFNAEWLEWDGEDWVVHETIGYGAYHEPSSLRHYREPTVEDVLREFFSRYVTTKPKDEDDAIIAEYAAKLRLAEEVDA